MNKLFTIYFRYNFTSNEITEFFLKSITGSFNYRKHCNKPKTPMIGTLFLDKVDIDSIVSRDKRHRDMYNYQYLQKGIFE